MILFPISVAMDTVNAASVEKANGSVVAMKVGMVPNVGFNLKSIVVTIKTMIKVTHFIHLRQFPLFLTRNHLISSIDGLIDCEDPECCGSHACRTSQLCVSAPRPADVLLRKQPQAVTASFFERMKFLIDEGSLQNYAKMETFNER